MVALFCIFWPEITKWLKTSFLPWWKPWWEHFWYWNSELFWILFWSAFGISFVVGLIVLAVHAGAPYVDDNQERLCHQSYSTYEANPEIRIQRMRTLASKYPHNPNTTEVLKNHTYETYESDARIREEASNLLNDPRIGPSGGQ
jgi:hypothetical protein